jgi:hypothetical protein
MGIFDRYFREAEEESVEDIAGLIRENEEVVAYCRMPYHAKMMRWLGENADAPLKIGDHTSMIAGTARANTLKEVRAHLLQVERMALDALQSLQERTRG